MSGTFPNTNVSDLNISKISLPKSSILVCSSPTPHCLNPAVGMLLLLPNGDIDDEAPKTDD